MKDCCEKFADDAEPQNPSLKATRFSEIQRCKCGQRLKIVFATVPTIGNPVHYQSVGVEVVSE